jgi:hypothetical protein
VLGGGHLGLLGDANDSVFDRQYSGALDAGECPMTQDEPAIVQREIRRLPFDAAAISAIAALLGGTPKPATFAIRGEPVLQLDVPAGDRTPTTLTFWPSLHRVDAKAEGIVVVFTEVATVDLVEEVEALFRRTSGEYLIVAIGGKVIVRA